MGNSLVMDVLGRSCAPSTHNYAAELIALWIRPSASVQVSRFRFRFRMSALTRNGLADVLQVAFHEAGGIRDPVKLVRSARCFVFLLYAACRLPSISFECRTCGTCVCTLPYVALPSIAVSGEPALSAFSSLVKVEEGDMVSGESTWRARSGTVRWNECDAMRRMVIVPCVIVSDCPRFQHHFPWPSLGMRRTYSKVLGFQTRWLRYQIINANERMNERTGVGGCGKEGSTASRRRTLAATARGCGKRMEGESLDCGRRQLAVWRFRVPD